MISGKNPLRFHGAPTIEFFDSVIIDVHTNKKIECKANKPITWISEVQNSLYLFFEIFFKVLYVLANEFKSRECKNHKHFTYF